MEVDERVLVVGLLVLVLGLNTANYFGIQSLEKQWKYAQSTAQTQSSTASVEKAASIIKFEDIAPKGTPAVYGKELGITYDEVSAENQEKANEIIRKLAAFDQSITLSGDPLQRYIRVAGSISCEYCCGVPSIITSDGQAACGCAHSYAMRGLAKYLLKYHASEFTDEQLLDELGKWKVLFFPEPMVAKAGAMKQRGMTFNYIDLSSNKYRGLEKQATASSSGRNAQVGGC